MLKEIRNKIVWAILKRMPVRKKTIIFEAYQGTRYACSPKALYEYLLHNPKFADYAFIWAVREPERYQFLAENRNTSLVQYRSIAYYKAYATSSHWISNGYLPELVKKKMGQIFLQCWHGTPLKKLRHDIDGLLSNELNDFDTLKYDYFISPSRFASEKFTSAFHLKELARENILIETGYPRNDFLKNFSQQDIDSIKERIGLPRGKQVILYAPTFRDDQRSGDDFTFKAEIDFDLLRSQLGYECVVLFRAHYNVTNSFNFKAYDGFVYDVTQIDDINELYVVSDVLVTDYSSVMFDYGVTGRPMIFFMYDRGHYEDDLRGFYLDLNELPGSVVASTHELAEALVDLDAYKLKCVEKYKLFNRKFNYLDDGHATERVVERVFG